MAKLLLWLLGVIAYSQAAPLPFAVLCMAAGTLVWLAVNVVCFLREIFELVYKSHK